MRPTKPGYYWIRRSGWEPVEVTHGGWPLCFRVLGQSHDFPLESVDDKDWGPEVKPPLA